MKNETLLILGGLGVLFLINKNKGEQSAAAGNPFAIQKSASASSPISDPATAQTPIVAGTARTPPPVVIVRENGGGILTTGGGDPTPTILPAETTYPVVFHPIYADPIDLPPVYESPTYDTPVLTRRPNGPVIYIENEPPPFIY